MASFHSHHHKLGFPKLIHLDFTSATHSQFEGLFSLVEPMPSHFEEDNAMLIGETIDVDLKLGDTLKIIKVGANCSLEEIS